MGGGLAVWHLTARVAGVTHQAAVGGQLHKAGASLITFIVANQSVDTLTLELAAIKPLLALVVSVAFVLTIIDRGGHNS